MAQPKNPNRGAEGVVDDVFITPRVVDRRALEEYSATLQDLVREAAGRGESLAVASSDVKALGESLREATKELKSRLELAVKIMPTLEQRLGKADQILQLATDRVKLSEHLDKTIDALAAERLARVEQRAAAIVESAERRTAALESSAPTRTEGLVREALTKLEASAGAIVAQSQEKIAGAHRAVVERAETAASTLGPRLAALEAAGVALEEKLAQRSSTIERSLSESLANLRADLAARQRDAADLALTTSAARTGWKTDLEAVEARAREVARSLNDGAVSAVDAVKSRLADELRAELREQLRAQLHAELRDQLRDQLRAELAAELRSELRAELASELRGQVRSDAQAKIAEFEVIASALSRSVSDKAAAANNELDARIAQLPDTSGLDRISEGLARLEALSAETSARVERLELQPTGTNGDAHDATLAAHEALAGSLRQLLDRAENLTGTGDETSLAAVVARGEELRASAERAAHQFEDIRKQADLARVMLGDWINTAAARIDEENARHTALQHAVESSAARIETARQTQEHLARTLSQTIELAQQAATMLSSASGAVRPAAGVPAVPLSSPTPPQAPIRAASRDELPQAAREAIERVRSQIEQ